MAVADARAEMRRTLEMAENGSVVLTTHGEPEAAVVSFATLEDMRGALMQLLVSEMEASFSDAQDRGRAEDVEGTVTSDEEIESLVGEAIRSARRHVNSLGAAPRQKIAEAESVPPVTDEPVVDCSSNLAVVNSYLWL